MNNNVRDRELVKRFLNGDTDAYKELVQNYRSALMIVVRRFIKNEQDCEEIVQDTLVQVYLNVGQFRWDCKFSTWIFTIALNRARNHFSSLKRRKTSETVSLDGLVENSVDLTLLDVIPDPRNDRSYLDCQELLAVVENCRAKLRPDHRVILSHLLDRGHQYSKIAHDIGIGIGTVKSRIARARIELHKIFEKQAVA